MAAQSSSRRGSARAARAMVVAALALSLGACSQSAELLLGESSPASSPQQTAATRGADTAAAPTRSELEKATEYWGKEHAKSPRDGKAAISYARNLKELGRKAEALAVLQSSYLYNAQDREYLSEFGRLALDQDQPQLAQQLLERADDPANPDWKIISARGAALAKQGQYKAAIPMFERAREIAPTQSSVLSNLALAYTMDGNAAQAEPLLRQAMTMQDSDPRIRQNLVLVLRLQGKTAESASVALGVDHRPQAAPASFAATTRAEPARVATVRRPAARTEAPTRSADAEADPDAVIRAALQAEVEKERAQTRRVATSAPRR